MILALLRERGEAGVMLPDVQGEPIYCERLAARIHDIRHPQYRAGVYQSMLASDEYIEDVGYTTARGKRVARYVLRVRDYSIDAQTGYDGRDGSLEITQEEEDTYITTMDDFMREARA